MKINWSKILEWSIVGVQAPYPLHSSDGVFAYAVDVMYRHHGLHHVVFPIERDRVYVTGQKLTLARATRFADIMFAKKKRDDIKARYKAR